MIYLLGLELVPMGFVKFNEIVIKLAQYNIELARLITGRVEA